VGQGTPAGCGGSEITTRDAKAFRYVPVTDTVRAVSLSDRLRAITLTSAERRVAEIVLGDPERVAFGTVADLARLAGTGGATVMRLAAKAGFDGFSELQATVQSELSRRLRPAVERIREPKAGDTVAAVLKVDVANLQETLGAVDAAVLTLATRCVGSRR
jgi:DNA-binding MurR/RpiR family transcriptional regulator